MTTAIRGAGIAGGAGIAQPAQIAIFAAAALTATSAAIAQNALAAENAKIYIGKPAAGVKTALLSKDLNPLKHRKWQG